MDQSLDRILEKEKGKGIGLGREALRVVEEIEPPAVSGLTPLSVTSGLLRVTSTPCTDPEPRGPRGHRARGQRGPQFLPSLPDGAAEFETKPDPFPTMTARPASQIFQA